LCRKTEGSTDGLQHKGITSPLGDEGVRGEFFKTRVGANVEARRENPSKTALLGPKFAPGGEIKNGHLINTARFVEVLFLLLMS
jgi:hypothetical protein